MDQRCHTSLPRLYPGRPPTPTIATFLIAAISDDLETEVVILGRSETAWGGTCPVSPSGNQVICELKECI